MHHRRPTPWAYALLCANFLSLPLFAQLDYGPSSSFHSSSWAPTPSLSLPLHGRLELPAAQDATRLRVCIVDTSRRAIIAETYASWNGDFEFPALPAAIYELQVRNLNGDVIHSTSVSTPSTSTLVIRLTNPSLPATPATVSYRRLAHKVPKAARKEFDKARRAFAAQHPFDTQAHLERALTLDPDYFEALAFLGAYFLERRQVLPARQLLVRALELDPGDLAVRTNFTMALLQLRRLPEAESEARSCLQSNAANSRAHFFLALSLLEQGKSRAEALSHLHQARADFPPAQALLRHLEAEARPAARPTMSLLH